MGDDLNLIPHNDKRFRTVEVDPYFLTQDCSVIDAEVEDYIKIWKKANIPQERHLGFLEGNHTLVQTSFSMNPIAHLCSQLKYPHLAEYSAVVPLIFRIKGSNAMADCIIKIHHGWGGTNSRQQGAGHNKYILDAKGYDNWDIALYGHIHDLWADPIVVLDCKSRIHNVEEKVKIVGCCGTFLKTLEKGKTSTYSERMGMPPRVISWLEIEIGFRTDHNKQNLRLRFPRQVPSM